jgi:glycosyltransferase involved in cell wall biosynthesis
VSETNAGAVAPTSPSTATLTGTSIVVPCYNEAARLDVAAFQRFLAAHPGVGFVFVNDGSTDGTAGVLAGLRDAAAGRVTVLDLDRNRGKAEAVRRGVLAALGSGAAYVGYWDADLATPLDAIPTFVAVLDRVPAVELVMGARVQLLGRQIVRRRVRHYLGRVFATVVSAALGLAVYDTQCGAKLFRATPATERLFDLPFRTTWVFDVELLARMIRAQRAAGRPPLTEAVYELPLLEWRDVAGSKVRPYHFVRAAAEVALIYRTYLWGEAGASETRQREAVGAG